jgi:type IX secretion system PorP/SprF family membrane protein
MKKIFCFLFLYIIINLAALAQQDPQFTFNKQTLLTVNPGYAGHDGQISGTILNRYQWDGVPGSPKTLVFSAGAATKLFGLNSGVGINIINDELGFEKNIAISLDYAYLTKTRFGDFGIGTSLGIYSKSITAEWFIPESGYHQTVQEDGEIPPAESSQLAFDVGMGAYLKSKDYFVAISATHLNQASILMGETARTYLARHYYLSGGYNITLSDPLFELQPSVYIKTDMAAYQVDFNVELVYNKRFSGGLNYRINDAVSLLVGFEMNNGLKMGYAYDIITSALAGYGGGSHELFLGYSLDLGKNRSKKYKSIRYL